MNKFINPKNRQEENITIINEVFSDLIDEFDAKISTKVILDDFRNEEYTLLISIPQIFTKNDSRLFYSEIIKNKIIYLENNNFRAIKKGTMLSRFILHYYVGFMECIYYDDGITFIFRFKTI